MFQDKPEVWSLDQPELWRLDHLEVWSFAHPEVWPLDSDRGRTVSQIAEPAMRRQASPLWEQVLTKWSTSLAGVCKVIELSSEETDVCTVSHPVPCNRYSEGDLTLYSVNIQG